MISIVQNFICTKPARLEVVLRNTKKLGKTFSDCDFYINYNSDNDYFEPIKNSYLENIDNINFYNNLERDWAAVTLSILNEVDTEFTMYICEDMEINCSESLIHSTLNEFFDEKMDYMFLSKIGKYIEKEYIDGFTPHNNISSPGYKPMEFGYHYLGKHAPHKRLSNDMMCRTDFFKETLEEFLVKGEQCVHEIPFRKRHLPNFYEGYYDFNNGMRRFPDLKCYIPSEVIFKEFDDVKDKD